MHGGDKDIQILEKAGSTIGTLRSSSTAARREIERVYKKITGKDISTALSATGTIDRSGGQDSSGSRFSVTVVE